MSTYNNIHANAHAILCKMSNNFISFQLTNLTLSGTLPSKQLETGSIVRDVREVPRISAGNPRRANESE